MNPILWGIVGLLAGWIATILKPHPGSINRIESLSVGVFGAFVGGAFLGPEGAMDAEGFDGAALGLAVAGAIVMLVLLSAMRKLVGPMRVHKTRRKQP